MKKEKKIQYEAIDKRATELAAIISRTMAKPGLSSMGESLIAMIAGVCKLIQMLSLVMGRRSEIMAEMFVDGINHYFKEGGDRTLTAFYNAMKDKAN